MTLVENSDEEIKPVFGVLWDRQVGIVLDVMLSEPEQDWTKDEIRKVTRLSRASVDRAISTLFHLEAIYAGGNYVTRNKKDEEVKSEILYYVRREGQRGIGGELRRLYKALSPYSDVAIHGKDSKVVLK